MTDINVKNELFSDKVGMFFRLVLIHGYKTTPVIQERRVITVGAIRWVEVIQDNYQCGILTR